MTALHPSDELQRVGHHCVVRNTLLGRGITRMLPVIFLPLGALSVTATNAGATPSLTMVVSASQTILPSLGGRLSESNDLAEPWWICDGHVYRQTCLQVRAPVPRVGGTTARPKRRVRGKRHQQSRVDPNYNIN